MRGLGRSPKKFLHGHNLELANFALANSKYLPRHTLSEFYKLYVRSHLDYGDVIYHSLEKISEFSHSVILPSQMEKLESVQYSAALAVFGAWRGTSQEKVYAELGWESLSLRRWIRRLTLFYKFMNNLSPGYTKDPIPPHRQLQYSFRNQDVVGQIMARTEKFQSSFYPNCLTEWKKLDPEIRLAPSVEKETQSLVLEQVLEIIF